MSPEIIGAISIVALLILIYARMYIGFAMMIVGFAGLIAIMGWNHALIILGTVPFRGVADYTFAAMPLFMMLGVVVSELGFASDLFYSGYKWIGQVRGGLAMATSVACAILGVVTDSMVAVITLGKSAIPEMRKYHYDESLSTASVVAGASLASLIPPSIAFIIYAILTGESIGKLYIAAIIPGILLTIVIIALIAVMVRINPRLATAGPKTSFKEKLISLKFTWSVGVIFVLILGGIYAGIFTPTEAGAIGTFGAVIIGLASRRLTRKNLVKSILETAQMTAMVVFIVGGAFVFLKMMTVSKLPFTLADFVVGLQVSKYLVMLVIILIYILLGMVSDIMGAILITVPILFPVIQSLGFDPIWFGVIMVILLELGFITPPIGMNVYILAGITNTPLGIIFRGVWPFVITIIIFVIIMVIFPEIVLFLPSTMK